MTQAPHLEMTGNLGSIQPTAEPDLERAVQEVAGKATSFARLPIGQKIELLQKTAAGLKEVASDWVKAACQAKGIPQGSPLAGEEWLAGPMISLRNTRLLTDSLISIRDRGEAPLGTGVSRLADGRLAIKVFPLDGKDAALMANFTIETRLQKEIRDETAAKAAQATFYKKQDPQGGVSVILGAGNVASIPPLDTIYKMFVDGHTAVLKMNPVNEYLGPFLSRAMAPLIDAGYLRIVYGGGEVGRYLVHHQAVTDVHITGSDTTHDLIVWGPPGSERDRRKKEHDPLLKKSITSELGNVSPIIIAPSHYDDEALWFQARNMASMLQNNGSFNCNAAKMLITAKGWKQREAFLGLVRKALGQLHLRKAYYPGAQSRYDTLLAGRDNVERFGDPKAGELAWALVTNLDPSDQNERLYQVEPFCGILSETSLDETDPAAFFASAATFCNESLWGTLNAMIVVGKDLQNGEAGRALDQAIDTLRYGAVGINHWPALVYSLCSPPWGGHPSATLENIQSGLGWVHNTFLLGGVEKSVLRGPLTVVPKPPWFYDNRMTHELGRRLTEFEAAPSWLRIPGVALTALRG